MHSEATKHETGSLNAALSPAPFFSVVTCTYNRAGLIRRALDSLLAQQCGDWECLIVDDASTDDTADVVAPYLRDGRFRYVAHAHQGCALSKNTGIRAAGGRYVTFLDSDDEYLPEHLAVRMETLLREPQLDLLFSDVEVIGNPWVADKDHPGSQIAVRDCVVGGTFVLRREVALKTGGFPDVSLGDDALLMDKLVKGGYQIKKIASATYVYYRDTPDSMCSAALHTPS